LYYEIAGKGDNIILIHDGLIHCEIWDKQFPVFAKSYCVVRYDRRGYGKSPNPPTPFSDVEDLKQLFVQLRIDKAIVFGMSAGGGLAIDFTLKYPQNVSALVLVGAIVGGFSYTSHFMTRGGHVNSLEKLLASPPKMIQYFGREDPYQIYPENLEAKETCLKLLQANPINVDAEKFNYMKPAERTAIKFLSEISVPTLVLVGEFDIPDVHAHSGAIESGIPDAKRRIIYNSGHLIPFEQPEAFNASVIEFLNSIEL
ncbi:MAG: alpha/beta hydrolase, partial [Bacteroidetes bacterium]|nr:alpha/beta hydrolase [Bacteroidota bacterium]